MSTGGTKVDSGGHKRSCGTAVELNWRHEDAVKMVSARGRECWGGESPQSSFGSGSSFPKKHMCPAAHGPATAPPRQYIACGQTGHCATSVSRVSLP